MDGVMSLAGCTVAEAMLVTSANGDIAWDARFVIHNQNALWFHGLFMFVAALGVIAAEQPRDERGVGDAAHMALLVFAGEAFDGAHQDRGCSTASP